MGSERDPGLVEPVRDTTRRVCRPDREGPDEPSGAFQLVKYDEIEVDAPLAEGFRSVGHPGFATVISVGALIGLTTVMMILMLGQSRVFFAMSRDRLLPPMFAKVSPRFGTPVRTTILTGTAVALISTFVPLTELA